MRQDVTNIALSLRKSEIAEIARKKRDLEARELKLKVDQTMLKANLEKLKIDQDDINMRERQLK